jgi:hypothetical protein
MKRPSFLEGALVALIGAGAGTAVYAGLGWVLPGEAAVRLVAAGLGLAYLVYLLGRSPERTGRPTVLALWLGTALGLWVLAPPLPLYLAAHLGALWVVRCLFFHQGPLTALADLGLTLFGLIAAAGAFLHTGSLFLTLWTLFLVQALFVLLPEREAADGAAPPGDDRFECAHRAAEEAVRRLSAAR